MEDELFMRRALELAREAADEGEVPVGCVVVRDGEIVGEGRNRREEKKSALSHAETEAIAAACARLGDWRLEGCALYVTLEPCPMCAGAILNARVSTLVYGAEEPRSGCCGSVLDLFEEDFGWHPRVYGGVLAAESAALLAEFFARLREKDAPPPAKNQ